MSKRLPKVSKGKFSTQSPAREVFDVLTITYRLLIISSLAALAVIIIAFTASLAFAPTYTISDNSTSDTSKVLGASTNNKGDESFFHKVLRIEPVEGNNIQITNNKEENTITIASTGSIQVTGDSGSTAAINLSAGAGISISGSFPDILHLRSLGARATQDARVLRNCKFRSTEDVIG